MSGRRVGRLAHDMKVMLQAKKDVDGVFFKSQPDGNSKIWICGIVGPKDTPYENAEYELEITLNDGYPASAPKVRFTHPVYHPNIDMKGEICVDILKGAWSPTLKIFDLLVSLRSLLGSPNFSDPLNPDAAIMFKDNKDLYDATVKKYVKQYAMTS